MSLPDCIKLIRQKSLLNQEEFAQELNVGLTTVNRWEVGKSIPNISGMKKIKAYCEKHSLSFELVENEWLSARLEAKR